MQLYEAAAGRVQFDKKTSLVGYGREKMENSKLKTLNVR